MITFIDFSFFVQKRHGYTGCLRRISGLWLLFQEDDLFEEFCFYHENIQELLENHKVIFPPPCFPPPVLSLWWLFILSHAAFAFPSLMFLLHIWQKSYYRQSFYRLTVWKWKFFRKRKLISVCVLVEKGLRDGEWDQGQSKMGEGAGLSRPGECSSVYFPFCSNERCLQALKNTRKYSFNLQTSCSRH